MKTKEEKQLFLKKLIPFSLTVLVILADQITKILVVKMFRRIQCCGHFGTDF